MHELSDKQNELVIRATQIGMWDWNIQSGELYVNEKWANLVGYTRAELAPININTWMNLSHPDDLKKANKLLNAYFNKITEVYELQLRMKHKNGHWVWLIDKGKVFEWDKNGKPLRMCGSHIEITKEKILEFNLKKALNERNILLKEVHHRVKNNLQLLLSLLKIRDNNDEVSTKEMENSILSIAKAYEAIYKSDKFDKISVDNYLNQVISPMISKEEIDFTINSIEFYGNINSLVPLGLIITELITNSLKHAFKETPLKKINIKNSIENNKLIVHYKDNGIGYGEKNINPQKNTESIGITIIQSLVQQLKGTLQLFDDNGANTKITITLPK